MPRPPTWEDDAAAEVEGPGGEDVGGGAHGGDAVAGDGDGAVAEDAELAVHGDDDRAVKDGVRHLRGSPPRGAGERPYDGAAVGFVSLRAGSWTGDWRGRLESGRNRMKNLFSLFFPTRFFASGGWKSSAPNYVLNNYSELLKNGAQND